MSSAVGSKAEAPAARECMKAIQFARFGSAVDVSELVDVADPGPPEKNEVLIEVLASPINPSEFLSFEGRFGSYAPKLPAFAGGEAVGRVLALGPNVDHLKPGDRVLTQFAGRGSWRERLVAEADGMFPLPVEVDTLQLAMLGVNPATALNMLRNFVPLRPGDWVLQDAGNSSVGYNVIRLARRFDLRTVSIVRGEDQAEQVRSAGGNAVIVDGPDLPARVADAVDGAQIPLAFDAVAGRATKDLAKCVAPGGTVVIYGVLSGEKSDIDATDILFRDVRLRGFWLTVWFRTTPHGEKKRVYEDLVSLMKDGTLNVPIEATYSMRRFKEALAHAAGSSRRGKILLRIND
jgi:trans-2-enoyl-CoA reductase